MTELKCPVCNTLLEEDIGYDGDYSCSKCGRNKMFGSEELWQALIDTKKKLDMAINAMESASNHNVINCVARGVDPKEDDVNITLSKALEQINNKEQQ